MAVLLTFKKKAFLCFFLRINNNTTALSEKDTERTRGSRTKNARTREYAQAPVEMLHGSSVCARGGLRVWD